MTTRLLFVLVAFALMAPPAAAQDVAPLEIAQRFGSLFVAVEPATAARLPAQTKTRACCANAPCSSALTPSRAGVSAERAGVRPAILRLDLSTTWRSTLCLNEPP